jgi:hypothetical protein
MRLMSNKASQELKGSVGLLFSEHYTQMGFSNIDESVLVT